MFSKLSAVRKAGLVDPADDADQQEHGDQGQFAQAQCIDALAPAGAACGAAVATEALICIG